MPGYLLDSNHVQGRFNNQPCVLQKLRTLPIETQIRVCTITLGEIAAGHEMTRSGNPERRIEYQKHVASNYYANQLPISVNTAGYYGKIMGRIWAKHAPADKDISTDQHLVSLGVDINDVWIAALAWQHGLTLVTRDNIRCIREVLKEKELKIENWWP